MSEPIILKEKIFSELLNKYNAGDEIAFEEMVLILSKNLHEVIEAKYRKIDIEVINLLVRDQLKIEINRHNNQSVSHYYRFVQLRMYDRLVRWGIIKTQKSGYKITKAQMDDNNLVTEVAERLKCMKQQKKTTNTLWQYHKLLEAFEHGLSEEQYLDRVYKLTKDILLEFVENNKHWPLLQQEDIEDAIYDVIKKRVYKEYETRTPQKEFYRLSAVLKRSLLIKLDKEEKKKQKLYFDENNNYILENLEQNANNLIYPEPINFVLEKEKSKKIMELLNFLPERSKNVIIWRFFNNLKRDEIAKTLNISRERVVQIEKKALEKLKQLINAEDNLKAYFDKEI